MYFSDFISLIHSKLNLTLFQSLFEEDIGKDELIRRLKLIAKAFQEMGQDDTEKFPDLAQHLATEFYMDHPSKDVKLLVACCIADIFR